MRVTYKGHSKSVVFDGVTFPKGEPVEYAGSHGKKLAANRFFEVEGGETEYAFPTGDKAELEAWAKEHLGIDLDKRKGLPKLIAEVQEALEDRNAAV